jgi:hypothetical protein
VTYLPNGDLVTAGSDGIVRVFTRSKERIASDTQIKVKRWYFSYLEDRELTSLKQEFEEEIAKFAIPS